MDPYNAVQRSRLWRASERDFRSLEPFRNLNRNLIQDFCGTGYGSPNQPRHEILTNLIEQFVTAVSLSIVANRPKVLVTPRRESLRPFARIYQEAVNNLLVELNIETTLRAVVLNALFSVGFAKIHLANSAQVQIETDVFMDPGIPYVSSLSLDCVCFDTAARTWGEVRYFADSYRIPFSDLEDTNLYDPDVVSKLQPTSKLKTDGDRVESISRGEETDSDEFEPMVDIADYFFTGDGRVYTFALDGGRSFAGKDLPPLAVMDWTGPEGGPYKRLSFLDAPEQIMPVSPVAQIAGLARVANSILRKAKKSGNAYKEVLLYDAAGADTAKRVKGASHGDMIEGDPTSLAKMAFGGVDPTMMAFFQECLGLFDRSAGNLPAMMGLGPQAETVGQEMLISSAVSKQAANYASRVVEFTRSIIQDLAYMLWNDAALTLPGRINIEGAEGYSVDATWSPGDREGNFLDYDLEVDPYSLPYQSPAQRVQTLNQLLATVYIPLAPLMAQQGGQINLQKLSEIHADLLSEPRLKEIIQFADAPMMPGGEEEGGGMPSSTTRNYVRKSVPTGGSAESRQAVRQGQWLEQSSRANQQQRTAANMPA